MSISVRGCRYGVKESAVCVTKKNEDKIRGSVTAMLRVQKYIVYVLIIPSSKGGKEFYLYGWNIRILAVSGAVVGEKAVSVKADLKVVSEVQKTNICDSHP
jgi:hypothetical protein